MVKVSRWPGRARWLVGGLAGPALVGATLMVVHDPDESPDDLARRHCHKAVRESIKKALGPRATADMEAGHVWHYRESTFISGSVFTFGVDYDNGYRGNQDVDNCTVVNGVVTDVGVSSGE